MNAHNASLPSKADAIRETHGDWLVSCAVQAMNGQKRKLCVMTQEQFHDQTRQRALAIELKLENGGAKGILVLPFGLCLLKGAIIGVDDAEPSKMLPYHTALSIGCVIDLDFDASALAMLKTGSSLKVELARGIWTAGISGNSA